MNNCGHKTLLFIKTLLGHSPDEIEGVLFPFLYDRIVLPSIKECNDEKTAQSNLLAGMALKEWAKHVGSILSHYPPDAPFNAKRFFIASELSANASIELPIKSSQKTIQVKGKIDALLFDYHQDQMLIYEYKSGQQKKLHCPDHPMYSISRTPR